MALADNLIHYQQVVAMSTLHLQHGQSTVRANSI